MLVNRKLEEYGSKPLDPIHFMRCKPNGNYLEYQRHNGYDYCVFPQNGTLRDRPVQMKYAKDLSCCEYSLSSSPKTCPLILSLPFSVVKSDRKPYEFYTDCIKKYNESITAISDKEKKYSSVVGWQTPRCDLDGSYAPVQCFNNKCTCVNEEGVPIKDANGFMSVDRNDPFLAANQRCSKFSFLLCCCCLLLISNPFPYLATACARHLEKIRAIPESKRNKMTDLFRRYQCNKNGNYLPIQCSDSACYCVDEITGYATDNQDSTIVNDQQTTSHVLKSDPEAIKTLFCNRNTNAREKLQFDKIFKLSHN